MGGTGINQWLQENNKTTWISKLRFDFDVLGPDSLEPYLIWRGDMLLKKTVVWLGSTF